MAGEKPESSGFLAMVDAKIAALQQLRESLIAAISVGALGQFAEIETSLQPQNGANANGGGSQGTKGPIELPTGVFRDKGLADAIRLYLSIAKRKQLPKEIQSALIEGGLATTSEFFEQTLSATLHRMRKTGELLQFKDGWDLASSYPEGFRQRMAQSVDAAPKRKKKAKKKAESAKKAESKPTTKKPGASSEPDAATASAVATAVS